MALLTAPLMSIDASGSVAKTLVFSKWKGRNYVRQHVIPHNPQSALQTADRASVSFLSREWKNISTPDQSTWQPLADTNKFSPFNAYLQYDQKRFANYDAPSQAYPAAEALSPAGEASNVAVVDNRLVTVTWTPTSSTNIWGVILCLSDSAMTGTSRGLVVQIQPLAGGVAKFVLGPFKPGTYNVMARAFSPDGKHGNDGTNVPFTVV